MQTYIRELIWHLPAAVDADLSAVVQSDVLGELPPEVTPVVRRPTAGWRRAMAAARSPGPADLVHGLDLDLPWRRRSLNVTTVHDLTVFDAPWALPRHRVIAERRLYTMAMRRAHVIIAVSAFTAQRVKDLFGRDPVVIPEAPRSDLSVADTAAIERVRRRYSLPERFVLHVGNIEPRKDVRGLAQA
ncbi:MAG TPA: glycosyltransferase, partial [Acidimicrobiales bacterium]|nr:glycosyltransferase [Acidimicrobiales bacterium]